MGQLGGTANGSYNSSFTLVSTADNIFIACGYQHAFIVKNDGSLWATGTNGNGQLGLGDAADKTVFTYSGGPGFIF
jgi:alpha-tubulin suppressor-like RCC1 family protein